MRATISAGLYPSPQSYVGGPAWIWRGRRLLLGKWRRLTRWEYWPFWLPYAPVFFYVLWLVLIYYRRPTIFTLCNPGIPYGGFIGESKSALLATFPYEAEHVLPWDFSPPDEPLPQRLARLHALQAKLERPWPIVIKPDEGQRGLGVTLAKNDQDAERSLKGKVGLILQAYDPGRECGIFYQRFPGQRNGRITSIAIKEMTAVTGDGEHTLAELILADGRAVNRGAFFLGRMIDRLEDVPGAGQRVPLVELGTHCQGATFVNGEGLLTPELAREVDRIAKMCNGFYYGRFDFRFPNIEALQAGRGLKLIEVNGVTSTAVHVLQPGTPLNHAWRTFMAHWHAAIRIGLAHERRGLRTPNVPDFLLWWWRCHWRQRKIGK